MISRFLGLVLFISSLAVVYLFEGSASAEGSFRLFHWPAMVLTGIGPIAMVLLCFDGTVISRTLSLVFGTSPIRRQRKHDRESIVLQKLAEKFYQEGASAFEGIQIRGISQAVETMVERLGVRMPTADIRDLLSRERDRCQIRTVQAMNVVNLGVRLAPSLGMLGTILGMVRLLASLQDPSLIGSHMSMALLTTFYGLFFSVAVWTPPQQKLERILDVELEGFDQAIRWVELLEKRKPTNYFADSVGVPAQSPAASEAA